MDLKFPIGKFPGKFDSKTPVDLNQRLLDIAAVAEAAAQLRKAVAGLDDRQLDTPYRPEGWTVRQVIHHVPDSHINAYIRFRFALTEDTPIVKPYDEAKWAELHDAKTMPAEVSLTLLDSLHRRWVDLLRSFSDADFARTLQHPQEGIVRLDTYLSAYAWHGKHHCAHITSLRERMGWK